MPGRAYSVAWKPVCKQQPLQIHQLIIDRQLKKTGVSVAHGQVVKLLETQIALAEANEGIAVIPSFGMLACRNRKVTMSELIDPVVNLNFYQITNRGSRMSDEAKEFSGFLKTYITSWEAPRGLDWSADETHYFRVGGNPLRTNGSLQRVGERRYFWGALVLNSCAGHRLLLACRIELNRYGNGPKCQY